MIPIRAVQCRQVPLGAPASGGCSPVRFGSMDRYRPCRPGHPEPGRRVTPRQRRTALAGVVRQAFARFDRSGATGRPGDALG
jgi:hypothetical protein